MAYSNYLGSGEIMFDAVNINGINASDAIYRMRTLEGMVLRARLNGKKADDLLNIATYALKGTSKDYEVSQCYNLKVEHVDINELSEKGLADRYEELTKQIHAIIGIHSFLEVARLALTGVPF